MTAGVGITFFFFFYLVIDALALSMLRICEIGIDGSQEQSITPVEPNYECSGRVRVSN